MKNLMSLFLVTLMTLLSAVPVWAQALEPLNATFTGAARVKIPNLGVDQTANVSIGIQFSANRQEVQIVDFPAITTVPYTVTGSLTSITTITLKSSGTGTFDPVSGHMTIDVVLLFDQSIDVPFVSEDADLPLRLHTDAPGGAPLDRDTGEVVLADTSKFEGKTSIWAPINYLSDQDATVEMSGTISPSPYAFLTLQLVVAPSGNTGLFNLLIDGAIHTENAGDGGSAAEVVTPGRHVVGQTVGTDTVLAAYSTSIGGDCATDGSVVLEEFQHKTCVITNTSLQMPRLTVTKIVLPDDDPGLFDLLIDGATFASQVNSGGSTGPQELPAGKHTVAEVASAGTDLGRYDAAIGGDCAADGSITLLTGDVKNCTISNSRLALVIKNVHVESGGAKGIIDWETNMPATSQVEYGTTTSYGLRTRLDTRLVTNHTALLTGLRPNTRYFYRITSTDATGQVEYETGGFFNPKVWP